MREYRNIDIYLCENLIFCSNFLLCTNGLYKFPFICEWSVQISLSMRMVCTNFPLDANGLYKFPFISEWCGQNLTTRTTRVQLKITQTLKVDLRPSRDKSDFRFCEHTATSVAGYQKQWKLINCHWLKLKIIQNNFWTIKMGLGLM
jgi:hypothetical protein